MSEVKIKLGLQENNVTDFLRDLFPCFIVKEVEKLTSQLRRDHGMGHDSISGPMLANRGSKLISFCVMH